MKILLTGATGYIGKRLLLTLVSSGHEVICCVRDVNRFNPPTSILSSVEVIEVDFLNIETLDTIPEDIQGAYYLMHSMSTSKDYDKDELISASNFREVVSQKNVEHVIYLSGIINVKFLSKHLASRKAVEMELAKGQYHFTSLRAGIIIGSGSASFEIIRDLVEKLPIMVGPKWLQTKCQPISIRDVLLFLSKSLFDKRTYDKNFDIGGPDVLSYKDMLLGYSSVRGLKRRVFIFPLITPAISAAWLHYVTSVSHKLATALVNSMKVEVVCSNNELNEILGIETISYVEALERTLKMIKQQQVISSWKDSMISGRFSLHVSEFVNVPKYGCYGYHKSRKIQNRERCIERIWSIGGDIGWYYSNWLWKLRGNIDQLCGGVGLRRGRTNPNKVWVGDAIDFWRVLYANRDEGRLMLFAEMKLPGEAWLEFKIVGDELYQSATFRPKGILGRLYWFIIYPIHALVFRGLLAALTK